LIDCCYFKKEQIEREIIDLDKQNKLTKDDEHENKIHRVHNYIRATHRIKPGQTGRLTLINPRLQSWTGVPATRLSNGFNRLQVRFGNKNR